MPFPNRATQFQKGESGNPAGRPRDLLATALRGKFDEVGPDGRSALHALADVLIAKALAGDIGAIRLIWDRIDGKVPNAPKNPTPERVVVQVVYKKTPYANEDADDQNEVTTTEDAGEY